ncbi:MAG: chromosomal replication initiator protein DnaA [Patescibacteria group bacterium]|nr:chromosomal replication initiator protein DnaA [Patescibacteria group bacterium]
MNNQELWQKVLAQIQFNISPANFATWFRNTKILSKQGKEIIVSVPNNFSKEWLEGKYNKIILKILREADDNIREVKYKVSKTAMKIEKQSSQINNKDNNQLEFQELKINKITNLNPKYAFDNFVIGAFNELSHAALSAVAKKPGIVYNPLFIYGGVGLGKTHLIQATGNEIAKSFPKKKIKYISSEKFISGMVKSIRTRTIDNFKNEYNNLDVLITDDIQFFTGKEKTQEEFFHIFNNLYEKNKQIIISSDRPPKAIQSITERLRSRFEGGMTVDIGKPDTETRIEILKLKAQAKDIKLEKETIEYIAENIKTNIRELEGAINSVAIYRKENNKNIDLSVVKTALKKTTSIPQKPVSCKKVIQAVAEFYDLKEKEIYIPTRKKEIVKPRQIAMYLLRDLLKYSFPFIGRKFQGKDHTTTIYAFSKISKEIENNEILNEEINLIKQRLCS